MPSKEDAKEYFADLRKQIKKDQMEEEKAQQEARGLEKVRAQKAAIKTA